jgi:hypothetical protein
MLCFVFIFIFFTLKLRYQKVSQLLQKCILLLLMVRYISWNRSVFVTLYMNACTTLETLNKCIKKICIFLVLVCPTWGEIQDGWKICHVSSQMRRGSVCRFGCYGGHELVGQSKTTCLDSEQWDTATQPSCQSKYTNLLLLPWYVTTVLTCMYMYKWFF